MASAFRSSLIWFMCLFMDQVVHATLFLYKSSSRAEELLEMEAGQPRNLNERERLRNPSQLLRRRLTRSTMAQGIVLITIPYALTRNPSDEFRACW